MNNCAPCTVFSQQAPAFKHTDSITVIRRHLVSERPMISHDRGPLTAVRLRHNLFGERDPDWIQSVYSDFRGVESSPVWTGRIRQPKLTEFDPAARNRGALAHPARARRQSHAAHLFAYFAENLILSSPTNVMDVIGSNWQRPQVPLTLDIVGSWLHWSRV